MRNLARFIAELLDSRKLGNNIKFRRSHFHIVTVVYFISMNCSELNVKLPMMFLSVSFCLVLKKCFLCFDLCSGENVPPVPIEDRVKALLPFIGNAMLVGDQRKFLSLLLTLKSELNLETVCATDKLTREAQQSLAEMAGLKVQRVGDVLDDPAALAKVDIVIRDAIERANRASTSRAQRVNKYKLLPIDFSLGGGELGPTLKLRRPVVHKMYKELIDQIYSEPPPPGQASD